jgi:diguanylate cyclase (GGDEF)-like protein
VRLPAKEHRTAGPDRRGDAVVDVGLRRRALLVAGAIAVTGAHALVGGWTGLILTIAISVGSCTAIHAGVRRRRPKHPRAWYALATALALFGLGTATARLARLHDLSSTATIPVQALGYAVFLGAEMYLTRARRGGRALADLLDIAVFGSAASIVAWRWLWAPHLSEDTTGTFFFLCVTGVVVAIGARILFAIRQARQLGLLTSSPLPSALILASFYPVTIAGAASVCGVVDATTGVWFHAAWPLSAGLLVAAAWHPDMRATAKAVSEVEAPVDHWRLYLIGAATPVPLVVGIVTDLNGIPGGYVFGIGILMNALVTVRTAMAFRRTTRELDGRIAAEAELQQQARFDTLTGLANRVLFTSRLEDAIERADADGSLLAVLYLDLDRFKVVNDSFGQRAGDQALVAVADRLRGAVRDQDTPARLSGDEFAVVLEALDSVDDAFAIAERIRESVREPIAVAGTSVVVGASVGMSVYDEQARPADLLREADVALTDAKRRGRNAVAVFDASLRAHIAQTLAFEHDLVDAVGNGELRLHYQPQIDLGTGAVCGVEALIRWQHPTQGLLAPGAFIEIAEDTGLIVPIGAWVIEEACRQHRRWQAALGADLVPHIAVNVSPTQLARDDVAGRVQRALAATRLDASQLHIEITEVALMGDPERAALALNSIERQGVAIAVDDFGTGYFSLSHLRRFPVHCIKVDQSFVWGIGTSVEDEAIIDATIGLAHALGLSVVAEGVETEEQLAYVRRKGCDVVQGYYFAKPMPPDELAAFVQDWAARNGVAANRASDRQREMAPITGPAARSLASGTEAG